VHVIGYVLQLGENWVIKQRLILDRHIYSEKINLSLKFKDVKLKPLKREKCGDIYFFKGLKFA
jgi:hypothetical protein